MASRGGCCKELLATPRIGNFQASIEHIKQQDGNLDKLLRRDSSRSATAYGKRAYISMKTMRR